MSRKGRVLMAAALLVTIFLPLAGCGLKTAPQPPGPKQEPFVSR